MSDSDTPTVPPNATSNPPAGPVAKDLAEALLEQSQSLQALIEGFEDFTKTTFPGSIKGIHTGIAAGFQGIDARIDELDAKIDTVTERHEKRMDWLEENFGHLAADVGELARHVEALAEDIERMKIERSSNERSTQSS